MRTFLVLSLILSTFGAQNLFSYLAVAIDPVVDLVARPLGDNCRSVAEVKNKYLNIQPFWIKSNRECPRVHQVLFNEVVDIVAERDYEVCLTMKNAFYGSKFKDHSLWALKSSFVRLDTVDEGTVPQNIDFRDYQTINQDSVVTLMMPFYDSSTNKLYSAGTRFCCVDSINNDVVVIKIRYHTSNNAVLVEIPSNICFFSFSKALPEHSIVSFIKVLRMWAISDNNYPAVPFIWGGASFCYTQVGSKCISVKERKKITNEGRYAGFDASGLILRATQICSIPYFYKNSTTAEANLNFLKRGKMPTNGDLLVCRGFIAVVSDVAKHKLIRATTAAAGYGYVVENNLNELFEGINTYQELVNCIDTEKELVCIGSKGEFRCRLRGLKIGSIRELWNTQDILVK